MHVELGADFEDIAPMLRARKKDLRDVDLKLSAVPKDQQALREAIERKAENWREILSGDHFEEAGVILEQFVGPFLVAAGKMVVFYDIENERIMPSDETLLQWSAKVNPAELFEFSDRLASLNVPSWNRLHGWLQEMDLLRKAA